MGILRAAIALGFVATLAAAQASCGSQSTTFLCVNNGCRWCSSYTYGTSSSLGSCVTTATACGSTQTAIQNTCTGFVSQTTCTASPVCGWCPNSATCLYIGWSTSSFGTSICNQSIVLPACSTATDRASCYNRPGSPCYWMPATSVCTSSYSSSSTTLSNDCTTTTASTCTSSTSSTNNAPGLCGWCTNAYSTGTGQCMYYSAGTSPAQCASSASFTFNTVGPCGATGMYLSYNCFGDTSCKWCSGYTYTSSDSGACVMSTASCTSFYPYSVSNPCTALTSSATCKANAVCGWCGASSKCMFGGIYTTTATPSACASGWSRNACSDWTTAESCNNAVSSCYWCGTTCSSSYCSGSGYYSTLCSSYGSSSYLCTTYSYSSSASGGCGFCGNYMGTNISECMWYDTGRPSTCASGGSWTGSTSYTYNGAAVAAAVGLVGALLFVVIFGPLICCCCIIGCTVYFCFIRPKNQTTVVVAGGVQQPMVGQPVQYGQPMGQAGYAQPGAYNQQQSVGMHAL